MYYNNQNSNRSRPAIEVGTMKTHGDVTSEYVDCVGAEIVGAYELCKKDLNLRGEIQSKVLTKAVEVLSQYGKAEIVNGDFLMFVADLEKVGVEKGSVKAFVIKTLSDISASAGLDVQFATAEAVGWINYVAKSDGTYTIASSYGNARYIINGDLASQRKSRRESVDVAQPSPVEQPKQEMPATNALLDELEPGEKHSV